jgi:cytochrome c553
MTSYRKQSLRGLLLLLASVIGHAALAQNTPGAIEQIVSQTCQSCHGAGGAAPIHPEYPQLAGLQAEYIAKQLNDFKSGRRKSPIMPAFVASLTDEQIKGIAAYFSAQKPAAGKSTRPELVEPGKTIFRDGVVDTGVPACAGCHLEDGSGTTRFPRIAGQQPEYSYIEMKKFSTAQRDNDRGLAMQSVTLKMTDKEMRAVAEYLATLK